MESEAPYRRIAAAIRDRIARGDLRPGDRVPSTRQIIREWGVAMATATRALGVLRDEGLVDTRPGSGTVVATAPTHPASDSGRHRPRGEHGQELNRDRVVRAAIAVADREGLTTVTMRRVATDLGVATMSLYRHVPGKEELLLAMTDTVFGEHTLPAEPPPGWRERLEVAGRMMWAVFHRHPWAAEVLSMTRPQITPNLLGYAEWSLAALRDLGLDMRDMMHAHLTLFGHVRGTALNLQREEQARQDTGMTTDEWMGTREREHELAEVFASRRLPALEFAVSQEFDFDLDEVFEFGLQRLLDGIALRSHAVRASPR